MCRSLRHPPLPRLPRTSRQSSLAACRRPAAPRSPLRPRPPPLSLHTGRHPATRHSSPSFAIPRRHLPFLAIPRRHSPFLALTQEHLETSGPLIRLARLGHSLSSRLFDASSAASPESSESDSRSLVSELGKLTQILRGLMARSKTHTTVEHLHSTCATKLAGARRCRCKPTTERSGCSPVPLDAKRRDE